MAAVCKILTQEDLKEFLKHPTCLNFLAFVDALNGSVRGLKRSCIHSIPKSPTIDHLLLLIDNCVKMLNDYRPTETSSRFGHVEFRSYFDSILRECPKWISNVLPEKYHDFLPEVASYFCSSFGNRQRIDYGTGHETHFIVFLYCLDRLNLFSSHVDDYKHIVLTVFWKYMEWMRKLQFNYWLEPAGSHGVWGLDDYSFFPFFFGSSQLIEHKYIKPKSIHNMDIIKEYSDEYLYMKSIDFITKVKSESLSWHSPMLNDISGVKTWSKINQGMRKMYLGEVLGKLPIMQHQLFGYLFGNIGFDNVGHDILENIKYINAPEFVSSSGHAIAANVSLHSSQCSASNEDEDTVEAIVKYITNSNGNKIPIYGKVPRSQTQQDENQPRVLLDTFALGQAHPQCCGIRIPSAIGAKAKDLLPFD